ncbi:GW dipeptide domain-containing protein [Leuconostoc falkenbergense]|uniref:GW dipeptide domain-containing protein n=1 Tax=Leuconostoc falkenbergense TaxID=2766470 RepID=UPI0024A7DF58|nr:GW dipeptide domain-containing protein [Leuconostoc falkenbergense]MDI6552903.1 GW dipeptide domain-containing protein [Leuconostoc falkenbergense]
MKKIPTIFGSAAVAAIMLLLNSNSVSANVPAITAGTTGLPKMDVVDVSSNNGNISVSAFEKMRKYGVAAVIVKLTEATSYRNPYAENQIANAKKAGLEVGAYHYSWYTSPSTAQSEAKYFVSYARSLKLPTGTLMVDDLEDTNTKQNNVSNNAKAFNAQLKSAGYTNTSTYTGVSYKNETGLNFSYIGNERVWVAQYPFTPNSSSLWNTDYGMWQWNSNTSFPGVGGTFDVSIDYTNLISKKYDKITSQKAVDYKAVMNQGTRNDGLYLGGPWNTSSENTSAKKRGKEFNQQLITVKKEAVTKNATWIEFIANDGNTYWMDKSGIRVLDKLGKIVTLNKLGVMAQSSRNDGLYLNGPYNTSLATLSRNSSGKYYNNQVVTVQNQMQVNNTLWYQVVVDSKTFWIDSRGISFPKLNTITKTTSVNYSAVMNQTSRNDGLYLAAPYNTSYYARSRNDSGGKYDGTVVTVSQEKVTDSKVTWAKITLGNKSYWIDKAGLAQPKLALVIQKDSVNYSAFIDQTTRNDGIFFAGPYNVSFNSLSRNDSAKKYNRQVVDVLNEWQILYNGKDKATWVQVQNGSNIYWLDKKAIHVFDSLQTFKTNAYEVTLNQSQRNDGLYYNGPYNTSINTLSRNQSAKKYNNQKVTVIGAATVTTTKNEKISWLQIQINGTTFWIDEKGVIK